MKYGQGEASQLWPHTDNIGLGAVNQITIFHDGQVNGTGSHGLVGSLEDFRIYNRALTDEEIALLGSTIIQGNNENNRRI